MSSVPVHTQVNMLKLSLLIGGVLLVSLVSSSPQILDLPCQQELVLVPKLGNPQFMKRQIACMLDQRPCDDLGKGAKRIGPDAVTGHCVGPCDKCTKKSIRKVIANEYPDAWNQIRAKLLASRRPGCK